MSNQIEIEDYLINEIQSSGSFDCSTDKLTWFVRQRNGKNMKKKMESVGWSSISVL